MHDLLCTSQELVNLEAIRTLRLYHTEFQALHGGYTPELHRGYTPELQRGYTPELQRGYTPELQQVEALMARVEHTVAHAPTMPRATPTRGTLLRPGSRRPSPLSPCRSSLLTPRRARRSSRAPKS